MRGASLTFSALSVVALLGACGSGNQAPSAGPQQSTKFDKFCTMEGLGTPIRGTVILVDAQSIAEASPQQFRNANPGLFALIMGIGNPETAVETGAVAPRERITLLIGDPVSGAIRPIFTGCVPGISEDELKARQTAGGDGALARYFGSDINSEVQKSREEFQKELLRAVAQVKPGSKGGTSDNFETSNFAKLLRATGPGSSADDKVRRIFIFSNPAQSLSRAFASYTEAREAGFAAAIATGANLGLSEAYLIPSGGPVSELNQAFLNAFFLGSRADLRRIAAFSPDGLSPVPTAVRYYSGELPLSVDLKSPMDIRLATAASGELVNSWISYSGSKGIRATPLAGQFTCADHDHCSLHGDPNGGLGQRWRTEPGPAPQPLPGGPFGGLRMIEATDSNGRLTGRIFDPVIFIGSAGDLKFEARRAENHAEGTTR